MPHPDPTTAPAAAPASNVVATASADALRALIRRKSRLKGRQPEEASLQQVRLLLGPAPARLPANTRDARLGTARG